MRVKIICIISVLIGVLTISCLDNELNGYNFFHPTVTIKLDKQLNEISGLQWLSDSTIYCVQDERARAYIFNFKKGKIVRSIDFGMNGDFEGIAVNGKYTCMLRSDGNIFISDNEGKAKEYKFKKEGSFDFEGICLDSLNNRLLVACKAHGKKGKRDNLFIYEFSFKDNSYSDNPVFKLKKGKGIHPYFKSSGIAIHPISKDIYVVSSFSKTLLVLSSNGEFKKAIQLSVYIYHQPEGITFSNDGKLFISNENNETCPTLIQLDYNKI